MKNKSDKEILSAQNSGATLLALAMHTFFPDRALIETKVNENGFTCDFLWDEPPLEGFLFTLQEKIETFKRSHLIFEEMTMMRKNAIQFLLDKNETALANVLETMDDNLITLSKVSDFYTIKCGEILDKSSDIKEFLLYSMKREFFYYPQIGNVSVLRIAGCCFLEKKEKVEFSKRLNAIKKKTPSTIAAKLNLLSIDKEVIWLSRGISIRDRLINLIKKEYSLLKYNQVETPNYIYSHIKRHKLSPIQENFDRYTAVYEYEEKERIISSDRSYSHTALFLNSRESDKTTRYVEYLTKEQFILTKDLDDLFVTTKSYGDISHAFLKENELLDLLTSSLGAMQRVLNILNIKTSLHCVIPEKAAKPIKDAMNEAKNVWKGEIVIKKDRDSDPKFEIHTTDLLGRSWPISSIGFDSALSSYLKNEPQKEIAKDCNYVLSQSFFLSVERILAILLEKYENFLPLWISPEQIRILSDATQLEYAKNLLNKFKSYGILATLDLREVPISNKINECYEQKVPIFVVIGKKQAQCNTISLHTLYDGDKILSGEPEVLVVELLKRCSQYD